MFFSCVSPFRLPTKNKSSALQADATMNMETIALFRLTPASTPFDSVHNGMNVVTGDFGADPVSRPNSGAINNHQGRWNHCSRKRTLERKTNQDER